MNIGILCNFYGFPQYIDRVLENWVHIKNCVFASASCKFDQYLEINYLKEDNETINILKNKYSNIFQYIHANKTSNDSTVRNHPLVYLLNKQVDYIWLLDQDEFYSKDEIENIINFVKLQEFVPYFKINFKNYFNDENHWVDGFCPPRIFKVKTNNLILDRFYFENDIVYKDKNNNDIDYKSLAHIEIPKNIAHVKHYSWCGDKEFLKNKVKYQNLRYKGICSYIWNEEKNILELNEDFYKKYNIEKPKIYEDTHIYNN
jgi:hypothetical protein